MNEQHQISTAENILHTDTLYIYDLTSMSMHLMNKFGNKFIALSP